MDRHFIGLLVLVMAASGCSATFKRETPARSSPAVTAPEKLCVSYGPEVPEVFKPAVEKALRVDELLTVAESGTAPPGHVDVRIDVNRWVRSHGTNFLVSWPGFIIFMPCWYRFDWDYDTEITVELRRGHEMPIIVTGKDKFACSHTTVLDGVQSELGFATYSIQAFIIGLQTTLGTPNPMLFDQDFIDSQGEFVCQNVYALVHQAFEKEREKRERAAIDAPSR